MAAILQLTGSGPQADRPVYTLHTTGAPEI